ncbi:MAG TPA: alpha/beta hydrolase [Acidobacteriota bacterium]
MPYLRVNEVDLYYECHGSGDPVLLIPGLGSDATTWSQFVPEFNNYQIVIVENRGSGRSAKPEGPYSTEMMAEDAVALMDHLKISQAHIVGKSMGGMIAQWIAARWPSRVRSLILASTVMYHDRYGNELLDLARTVAQKAGLFAVYRLTFMLSYSREYCMNNRSRLEQMEALIAKLDGNELLRGYFEQSFACQKHDSRAIASKIQSPTLVIVGQDDLITPAQESKNLAAVIPNAQLHIFSKGGHGFWREFPGEVNSVVRQFLNHGNREFLKM